MKINPERLQRAHKTIADGLLDMLDGDEEFIDEDWFREIEPKKE